MPGEDDVCDCKTDAQRNYTSSGKDETDDSSLITNDDDIKRGKALKCLFRFNGDTFVLDKKRSRLPRL